MTMEKNEIINGIIAKRKALNEEAMDKEARRDAHIEELEAKVKALAPRLGKMFDIAEALTTNGFYLGLIEKDGSFGTPKFCTDHIHHRVGFFCKNPYIGSPGMNLTMTGYFGIANGGACGEQDLKVDRFGNVQMFDFSSRYCDYKGIYIENLEYFLKKFDGVEKDLYEYAKNPISR